nr:MAG TPA: hypothetical protein [Caudoviricetes sp.]
MNLSENNEGFYSIGSNVPFEIIVVSSLSHSLLRVSVTDNGATRQGKKRFIYRICLFLRVPMLT